MENHPAIQAAEKEFAAAENVYHHAKSDMLDCSMLFGRGSAEMIAQGKKLSPAMNVYAIAQRALLAAYAEQGLWPSQKSAPDAAVEAGAEA